MPECLVLHPEARGVEFDRLGDVLARQDYVVKSFDGERRHFGRNSTVRVSALCDGVIGGRTRVDVGFFGVVFTMLTLVVLPVSRSLKGLRISFQAQSGVPSAKLYYIQLRDRPIWIAEHT